MEVVSAARKITGFPIPYTKAPRREGDPAVLVADSSKAGKVLGWKPVHNSMESIINTAWKWHKSNPTGYGK
jgi:UDP-glucose 4-epimerase